MLVFRSLAAIAAIAVVLAPAAGAQPRPDSLATMKQFKVATTDLNLPMVEQADATPTPFGRI